jgi:sulfonate transport system substrate-binding protein
MRFGNLARFACLAALLSAGLASAGARAEPLKVRIGWVIAPSNTAPLLAAKQDIARHAGKSYVIEPVHFSGTSPMVTAVASGELEIAPLAYSTFALAVQNAGLGDLRIIADDFQDGVAGYYTDEYMVLKDSPIKSVGDLKGKVMASNATGSAIDMGLRAMMRKHGLEDKRDYTIIEVGFANMKAVLKDHKVDLISAVPVISQDPELKQIARTLFTQKEAVGTTQMITWTARAGFMEKNRAALVDLMEDVLRARRFFDDPRNHAEVVDIVARVTKQSPQSLDPWVFVKGADYYRDPDGLPNLDALQANIGLQRELGFLKAGLDVRKYTDLSLVNEAAKRLK